MQLSLEHHGVKLQGSPYTWILLSSEYSVLHDPRLVDSADMEEPLVWRDSCNL